MLPCEERIVSHHSVDLLANGGDVRLVLGIAQYTVDQRYDLLHLVLLQTKRGYKIVSEGTDNHLMLVDLRTKFPELTGKLAEKCLVAADITTNKNMVPFDSRSPFQTSGLRFGTPAITTRGLKEDKMDYIVGLIDRVLHDPENEANIAAVRKDVNALMADYPLFAW